MNALSRFTIAAMLIAGLGGGASARSLHEQTAASQYYALSEGRGVTVDRTATRSGAVPPSESQTVMGLRVPR